MKAKNFISIIIPTYNRDSLLSITIESFVNQLYPKDQYEIIIVDNNSTDNTKETVEKWKKISKVHIKYLFEPRQGVHYARNTAAKIAKFELLYFTDDDMIADQNLLSEIIKPFIFDEQVGTATGRVLPKWETKPPKWIANHFANQYLSLLDPPEDFLITKQINFLYSCHQAIRRQIFFEAEGFNPEFTENRYLGNGEAGLNIKVKELGYKFGFNAKSLIYHIIPTTRMTQKYINRRFANGAISHTYSEYQNNYHTIGRRICKMAFRTLIEFPIKLCQIIFNTIRQRDISLLHFIPANISYYYTRLKYEIQILTDKRLKRFVLKKNWLTNDSCI